MRMQKSYDHIKALVGSQIDELVRQWNAEGIIYEGDFGFSSSVLEHEWQAILQVLEEAGCDILEGAITAVDMGVEGWMYAGFDMSRYDYKDAEKMIRKRFRQKNP